MTSLTIKKLDDIESLTRTFARERMVLSERLSELEAELLAVKRQRMRGIRGALGRAQDAQAELAHAIASAPELFVKPRTITVDGIKVGFAKGKGKIVWDDEEKVVALIEKHFPEQVEALVKTTRAPIRAALNNMTAAELRRIGCRVEESDDEIVIKPQDSELDKLVGRLLDESKDVEEL